MKRFVLDVLYATFIVFPHVTLIISAWFLGYVASTVYYSFLGGWDKLAEDQTFPLRPKRESKNNPNGNP